MDKLADHHGMYLFPDPGVLTGGGGVDLERTRGGGYLNSPHSNGLSGPMPPDGYSSPSIMSGCQSPGPGARGSLYQRYGMPPGHIGLQHGADGVPSDHIGLQHGADGMPAMCKSLPEFSWMKEKKNSRKDQSAMALANSGMFFFLLFYFFTLFYK